MSTSDPKTTSGSTSSGGSLPPPVASGASSPAIEEAHGEKVTILFEGARCIHARHCVLSLPQVFRANVQGPWLSPDAALVEEVVALAHNCPSGAIRYQRHDGHADESPPPVNVVRLRENGPLAFHGELHLAGRQEIRATLCRCGASKNKPYCDGSHHAVSFEASGEPESQETPALAARHGAVTIKPLANGPLHVSGNLEICAGTGRTVSRLTTTALCRCGGSKNKPFCDGTHRAIGFEAPAVEPE